MKPEIDTVNLRVSEPEQIDAELKEKLKVLKRGKWLLSNLVESLECGEFVRREDSDIATIVDEKFFSFDPLTELSTEEEELLRRYSTAHLSYWANREVLQLLSGDLYVGERFGEKSFFTKETMKEAVNPKKISLADKVDFLSNPNAVLDARITYTMGERLTINTDFLGYGNRSITEYAYSKKIINDLVEKRGRVNILDIGSGIGLALQDIKKAYGEKVETTGLSAEEDIVMFPADHQVYALAERMPSDFADKFYLIYSNIAFRYFALQNIALRNVVKALRVGGVAEILLDYDRGPSESTVTGDYYVSAIGEPEHYKAMKLLLKKELDRLIGLEYEGKIELNTENFDIEYVRGVLIIRKHKEFDY